MSDQIEEIKSKADIVELIGQRVVLKKAGRHFKGLCPFHSEKSPSFIVSSERQSYKCFGCGEGGDVLSFLQSYEGMSFLEALEFLAKRVGVVLESYRPTAQDSQKKRLVEALDWAKQYYQYLLVEHKSGSIAREYLQKRGITNVAREHFALGFAPNSWQGVSEFLIKKKGYSAEELVLAGLMIRGEGGRYYDRFRGRVMFPLRDHKGVVVGFSGRTLSTDTNEAKYINSPETMLYSKGKMLYGLYENREFIKKSDRVVVVEGELDMIPSWQAGVKEVVAIKGSAFTDDQARLIARFTKNVLFALDSDSAGQEAIRRAVKIADPVDLSIRVVSIKGGKDPGDIASESAASWKEMVKRSVLFYDFAIETSASKIDPSSGEGVKQIAAEVVPILAEVSNRVVQAHYVGVLSKKLSVLEERIYEEIERLQKKKDLKILSEQVRGIEQSKTSRRDTMEMHLLAMLLQNPELIKKHKEIIVEEVFAIPAVVKIVRELVGFPGEFEIGSFASSLASELRAVVDEAYLRDLSQLTTAEEVSKEFERIFGELRQMTLKEKMKKLASEISSAEKSEDKEKLKLLQDEFVTVTRLMQLAQ